MADKEKCCCGGNCGSEEAEVKEEACKCGCGEEAEGCGCGEDACGCEEDCKCGEDACECEAENKVALNDGIYLFASKTCPNCKIAEALLAKTSIEYTKLYAEDNVALTESLGIKQAPTMVVVKNGEIEKHAAIANVKAFIQANAN